MSHARNQLDNEPGRRLRAALREVCGALPEADETVDGFGHTTFKVRGRSFVIAGMDDGVTSLSLKSDLPNQSLLTRRGPYYRTPYIGKHGWVTVDDPLDHDWAEVTLLIRDGWRLAAPKRLAAELPAD